MWIWHLDLADDADAAGLAATHLTDDERSRADRGTGAVRTRRILLRAALRQALGTMLDLPPAQVPLRLDRGRPVLAAGEDSVALSCSASALVGLVAVATGVPMGVDVELHREQDLDTAAGEGWLHPREQAALRALPAAERGRALTRCWTQKEAVLKGLGVGLTRPPRTVCTPLSPVGCIGTWRVAPVPVPPAYAASLALAATPGGARVIDLGTTSIRSIRVEEKP